MANLGDAVADKVREQAAEFGGYAAQQDLAMEAFFHGDLEMEEAAVIFFRAAVQERDARNKASNLWRDLGEALRELRALQGK